MQATPPPIIAVVRPVGSEVATRLRFIRSDIVGGGIAHNIRAPVGEYEISVHHPDATLTGPVWSGGLYADATRPPSWGTVEMIEG